MPLFANLLPLALKPYAGRIALTLAGLVAGILMLTIGFWRTVLLAVLCAAGYLLGKWADGALDPDRLPIPARWR